jgi:hypothetical protein
MGYVPVQNIVTVHLIFMGWLDLAWDDDYHHAKGVTVTKTHILGFSPCFTFTSGLFNFSALNSLLYYGFLNTEGYSKYLHHHYSKYRSSFT